jgi:hypothetical protein
MASHHSCHTWWSMNTLASVPARFGHSGNKGFSWKLEDEEDKIFRASSANYSSFSPILEICSFGNGWCSANYQFHWQYLNFFVLTKTHLSLAQM